MKMSKVFVIPVVLFLFVLPTMLYAAQGDVGQHTVDDNITGLSGNTWIITTVDSNGGIYTAIALDTSDKVHISYSGLPYLYVKYATNASGSWVTTTLDSSGGMYT
ncbi:MAG: hypothetical protein U0586_17120, partial [Candidatus Brocadiaceae bacterium]